MVGCHDTEGYASLHPRLRATRYARAFDLSGRAAGLFYHGLSQNLGGFTQYCANLSHVCANLCFLYVIEWFWRWIFMVQIKDAIVHFARLHLLIFYPVWGKLFYCANAFGV